MEDRFHTISWQDGAVVILDQKALPHEERYVVCTDFRQVVSAIRDLTIRGAPAIGVAAALGIALGAQAVEAASARGFQESFEAICREFSAARPTARSLFWAVERMRDRCEAALQAAPAGSEGSHGGDPFSSVKEALLDEALLIARQDEAINRRLSSFGAALIPDGGRILTHCNAGALATAGYGTALGVIRAAREAGREIHVWVDETRPVLQGARLTAWELRREGIPCTLIADVAAGFLMQQGRVDLVILGADRIAANGDTANKIGTYGLAVLAKAHGIPFYVAAPLATFDLTLTDGGMIPIEERPAVEVTSLSGVPTAPAGMAALNPAFDITPSSLITAFITEAGVLTPPYEEAIRAACLSPRA